jgi:ribose transport system ATP-binding protein
MALNVRENLTLASLSSFRRGMRVRRSLERDEVMSWFTHMSVKASGPEADLTTLSGGNQQKIVLAKWLRMKPRLLLLDEPTQGVDVQAKAQIHGLIRAAAVAGTSVVLASSDEEELAAISDRVIVLGHGHQTTEMAGHGVTPQAIARGTLANKGVSDRAR